MIIGVAVKKRVLLVDDEARIGKILTIALKLHGYDIITTSSGAEAIELIKTSSPDIVLLDILLPDITGLDVLEKVRTFSQVPIIVFTARPEIIRLALENGANDSIGKPFDPDDLVKKLELNLVKPD
jgi:DNA-binding response OmpR family regulator